VVEKRTGVVVPFSDFSVLSRADGSPQLIWEQTLAGLDWTISVSHSAGRAFCALIERPAWPLGVDIERVDPHVMGFVGDYFTAAEQRLVAQYPESAWPLMMTAIWSAKEAALKALRVGLTQDVRSLSCLLAPGQLPLDQWLPFLIQWEDSFVAQPLNGWWRIADEFVQAVAVFT
jgi:4'-phosphopantetheinyl transferase